MTAHGTTHETTPAARGKSAHKTPLYPQLLRLKHVHPNAWQRAVLGEGMALLGGLFALADVASAWSILVLPVAVAAVVKAHDVLAGHLSTP
jgi:hypothetical protein